MTEPTPDEYRAYLEDWAANGDAAAMAETHPNCACEGAAATPGGFGPVDDTERLRYFVVSRPDIDKKKRPKSGITSAIFNRIFGRGVSTARLCKADAEELERTAKILYEIMQEKDGEYGGVLGVVDFEACHVRHDPISNDRLCCVLDTPFEGRPAHADLIAQSGRPDAEIRKGIKLLLFNAIGGAGAFRTSDQVSDCDLIQFLPDVDKAT